MKYSLDSEQLRLQNLKISLDNKNVELESFCQKLSSKDKIKFIAASILRKNSKFVHQLEEVDSRCKHLAQLVKHANEQLKYNEKEIHEMDRAILLIRNDPDYRIFEMRFFYKMKMDELADAFFFDKTTIWRKINRMLKKIAAYLDGDGD